MAHPPGLSSANLRGLGDGSTLVLLNGRRLANYAFDGEAVDLNSIPSAAIDRVEVLKDGASAIYGTDAIAGVINFILRKDYSGDEITGVRCAVTSTAAATAGRPTRRWLRRSARDGYNVFGVAQLPEAAGAARQRPRQHAHVAIGRTGRQRPQSDHVSGQHFRSAGIGAC